MGMSLSKYCPWCDKEIESPKHLGVRTSSQGAKGYQFALSSKSVARRVSVCPYCNKPVKDTTPNSLWWIAVVPAFLVPLVGIFMPSFTLPTIGYVIAFVLLLVGMYMAQKTSRLEKADDV